MDDATVTITRGARERYALRDLDDRVDGEGLTWWLYLPDLGIGVPHIGDHPLEKAEVRGWWRVPAYAVFDPLLWDPSSRTVEVVRSPGKTLVAWKLNDLRVTGYPDRLSPEEYVERTDDEEPTWDRLVAVVYEPVYEDLPPTREPVEGPWLVLDGAPPPQDGHEWHAQLPSALRHAPEYLHLFPGHLDGFRKAVSDALDELPGVNAYASGPGPVTVYVKATLPKPVPLERWAKPPDHRGHNSRERRQARERSAATTETVTRALSIPVADRVQAQNRAAAIDLWERTLADVVDYVTRLLADPCPTCQGHGWVEPANHQED